VTGLNHAIVCVGASLVCASIGAVCDIRTRKIPNRLTGPSILVGLLLHLILDGWCAMSMSALAGVVGGGIFLVFYFAGGMGAGDVKLMAAVTSIAGLSHVAEILIGTALAGGLLAAGLALSRGQLKSAFINIGILASHHFTRGLTPHSQLNASNPKTLRLPYGIAIAAGAAMSFCSVALR